MNIDSVYINFPAAYIKGLFLDLQGTLDKALYLSLYSYYKSLKDYLDKETAIEYTLKYFEISEANVVNGRLWYQDKDNLKGDEAANVSISISIFNNYFILDNDKDSEIKRKRDVSPFNVYCLALYCGLKSIQGGDTYAKTNREFLYKRVFGKDIVEPKVTDININKDKILGSLKDKGNLEIEKLKEIYNKYNTRHYFNKAIEELKRWRVSYYAKNTRGFYFGTNIDYKSLVKVANKKKIAKLVRLDKEKEAEEAAIKELIEELKGKL